MPCRKVSIRMFFVVIGESMIAEVLTKRVPQA